MKPAGKVAVVTGAALGVGKGIVRQLAQAGATVVIADINHDAAKQTSAEMRDAGGSSLGIHAAATATKYAAPTKEMGQSEPGTLPQALEVALAQGLSGPQPGIAIPVKWCHASMPDAAAHTISSTSPMPNSRRWRQGLGLGWGWAVEESALISFRIGRRSGCIHRARRVAGVPAWGGDGRRT